MFKNQGKNKVERAISEIRRSLPILIYDKNDYLLFAAAETLEKDLFRKYKLILDKLYITLTSSKVNYILKNRESDNIRLLIKNFDELLLLVNSSIEEFAKRSSSSK